MEIGWERREKGERNADYSEENCRNTKIVSATSVHLLNEKWIHTKPVSN